MFAKAPGADQQNPDVTVSLTTTKHAARGAETRCFQIERAPPSALMNDGAEDAFKMITAFGLSEHVGHRFVMLRGHLHDGAPISAAASMIARSSSVMRSAGKQSAQYQSPLCPPRYESFVITRHPSHTQTVLVPQRLHCNQFGTDRKSIMTQR